MISLTRPIRATLMNRKPDAQKNMMEDIDASPRIGRRDKAMLLRRKNAKTEKQTTRTKRQKKDYKLVTEMTTFQRAGMPAPS